MAAAMGRIGRAPQPQPHPPPSSCRLLPLPSPSVCVIHLRPIRRTIHSSACPARLAPPTRLTRGSDDIGHRAAAAGSAPHSPGHAAASAAASPHSAKPSALGSPMPTDAPAAQSASAPPAGSSANAASAWLPASAAAALASAQSLLFSLYAAAPSSASLSAALQDRALAPLRDSLYSAWPAAARLPRRRRRAGAAAGGSAPVPRVRVGRDAEGARSLCTAEAEFLSRRRAHSRTHLARYLAGSFPTRPTVGEAPDPLAVRDASLPSVGLCCSGGGYRAMLSTLGSLTALQQQGLFDAADYVAGLSGSTWAMAQIYANRWHIEQRRAEIEAVTGRLLQEQRQQRQTQAQTQQSPASPASTSASSSQFNPLLHSPVDVKRIAEDAMRKIAPNLFTGVPLDFIRDCLLDKWTLVEEIAAQQQEEQEQKEQKEPKQQRAGAGAPSAPSSAAASSSSQPAPGSKLSAEKRAAMQQVAHRIVSELAEDERQREQRAAAAAAGGAPSDPSAAAEEADTLSLYSFASLLSSIGLSDAFGWAISHKLLAPPPGADATPIHAAAAAAAAPSSSPSSSPSAPAATRAPSVSSSSSSSSSSTGAAAAASSTSPSAPPSAPAPSLSSHPRLSEQADLLREVSLPYPIYTAITRDAHQLEFTPHEVGVLDASDAHVPVESFGRAFERGEALAPSKDNVGDADGNDGSGGVGGELSLGLLLACFASAYPARIGRMVEEMIYTSAGSHSEPLLRYLHGLLHGAGPKALALGHQSAFAPAAVPNFLRGLAESTDPALSDAARRIPPSLLASPQLSVMDAGLAFNLPFPPLLSPARGLDVILAFDASSPPEVLAADAVRLASEYARGQGLPFPDLDKSVQPPAHSRELIEAALRDVSFSSLPADEENSGSGGNPPPPSSPSLLNADARSAHAASASTSQTRSLVRAAHSLVSVFPGDVARGVPTVVYLPLIANTRYSTSDEYRRRMAAGGGGGGGAAGAAAGAKDSTAGSSSSSSSASDLPLPSSSSSLSPSVHFDPRANFLAGGFCATLNFSLEPWQSEAIVGLSYHNCSEAADTFRCVLQRVREEKRRLLAHQSAKANASKAEPK